MRTPTGTARGTNGYNSLECWGHEYAGEVVEAGADVTRLEPGDPLVERLGMDTITVSDGHSKEFVDSYTDGVGFDVVFDATGHQSGVETVTEFVRKGGEIVAVGLPDSSSDLYLAPLVRGEVDLVTSYGSTWRNFERAIDLIDNEWIDIEAIVDTSFSVDEPESAFEAFIRAETCKPVFSFA